MQGSKPAYTSSLIQLKANAKMPDALAKKVVTENPTAYGSAVREKDKIVVEKFPKVDTVDENFKEFLAVQEGAKEFSKLFCFHCYPEEFDEDEVQPFIPLRDSKGNPLLVVGIEGDFPNFIDTSPDKYSEAFKLMNDWLGPKIEEMYKLFGNSPSKILEYLKSAQFHNDFGLVCGHRGVLTFLPTVGDMFVVEKNDLGMSDDWGYCSNVYGYTKPVIESGTNVSATPATEEPKKRSKYASDSPPTPAPVEPKPASPQLPPSDPVHKVAAQFVESVETISPPSNLHGKPLKKWYRTNNNGVLPDNWDAKPAPTVQVKIKRTVDGPKDMRAPAPTLVGETMPIISGELQKKANEHIKKHVGDGSAVIKDPKTAAEDEAKLATWTELSASSGVKGIEDIQRYTTSYIFAYTKANPEAAALLIIQLRSILRDGTKTLGELATGDSTDTGTKDGDGQTQPVKPDPVTVPPSVVEPAPTERKKSKYA